MPIHHFLKTKSMSRYTNNAQALKDASKSIELTKKIQPEYERLFGAVNKDLGYSLKTVKTKLGDYLVILYYSRNEYHCEEERKLLFRKDGKVFENNKQIELFNSSILS